MALPKQWTTITTASANNQRSLKALMFILSICLSISKVNASVSIAFHSGGEKKVGNNESEF